MEIIVYVQRGPNKQRFVMESGDTIEDLFDTEQVQLMFPLGDNDQILYAESNTPVDETQQLRSGDTFTILARSDAKA